LFFASRGGIHIHRNRGARLLRNRNVSATHGNWKNWWHCRWWTRGRLL